MIVLGEGGRRSLAVQVVTVVTVGSRRSLAVQAWSGRAFGSAFGERLVGCGLGGIWRRGVAGGQEVLGLGWGAEGEVGVGEVGRR